MTLWSFANFLETFLESLETIIQIFPIDCCVRIKNNPYKSDGLLNIQSYYLDTIVTASISKLLYSWMFIDPTEHHYITQTLTFNNNNCLNRASTMSLRRQQRVHCMAVIIISSPLTATVHHDHNQNVNIHWIIFLYFTLNKTIYGPSWDGCREARDPSLPSLSAAPSGGFKVAEFRNAPLTHIST